MRVFEKRARIAGGPKRLGYARCLPQTVRAIGLVRSSLRKPPTNRTLSIIGDFVRVQRGTGCWEALVKRG